MPRGWELETDFYPYVKEQICSPLAAHIATGELTRRGFQLFGIDLMFVQPDDPTDDPAIYLLEVNLRPKLDIPDSVSVEFQSAVKAIIDDVIVCIEEHHFSPVMSTEAFMPAQLKAKFKSRVRSTGRTQPANRFDRVFLNPNDCQADEDIQHGGESPRSSGSQCSSDSIFREF